MLVAIFLFSSLSSSLAFNITKLLGQNPELSTFNNYLTQTKLNDEINRRQTITVLVVDNSAAASLSGKSLDVIKKILSVHVILDYYDVEKITKLTTSKKTSTVTTLFQASGSAVDQEGFLKVALINEGEIAFGSAVKGASLNAKLVKSVAAQPFNISVLQITAPVQVPGIESSPSPPSPKAATPSAAPKRAPAPSNKSGAAPSPSKNSGANTPATAPSTADAPVADTPTTAGTSPAPAAADEPVADNAPVSSAPPQADAAADPPVLSNSGVVRKGMKIGIVAAALMSWLVV
ncbi:hypothetical protein F8388_024994 [Cannabis sativa]|uniref:FAS1 domain-containing protein n=1 Tax=Cannabis sativa TaxID=3483 RepID=A0A7J6G3C1_CANSA|nr:hypothetical protein F8388_024994 [Cannabis sativa]